MFTKLRNRFKKTANQGLKYVYSSPDDVQLEMSPLIEEEASENSTDNDSSGDNSTTDTEDSSTNNDSSQDEWETENSSSSSGSDSKKNVKVKKIDSVQKLTLPYLKNKLTFPDMIGYKVVKLKNMPGVDAMLMLQIPSTSRIMGDHGPIAWHKNSNNFSTNRKYITNRAQVIAIQFFGNKHQVLKATVNYINSPKSVRMISGHGHRKNECTWKLGKTTSIASDSSRMEMCHNGLHFTIDVRSTRTYWSDTHVEAMSKVFRY